jgi:two-component system LytT family sensor kinase
VAGRYNWQTQMSSPTSKPRVSTVWISAVGAFAAAFLALVSTLPTYFSMLTHGHSFVRMLAWQLSCWGIWAVVGPWIVRIQSRYGAIRLIALGVALTLAQAVISAQMTVWLHPFTPIATYDFRHAWNMNWRLSIAIDPLVFGLLLVAGSFLASYDRARRLELRESHLESELTRAQLDALHLEIQPHFLFNTLNSIAALIRMKDNQGALSMLVGLSEMMRMTLDRSADQLTPLGRELSLVGRYVDLQRARFGDRLDVSYRVDAECEQHSVPTFLLQPIVENALRHGLAPSHRVGHLEVGACLSGERTLRLWVRDDGVGLPGGFELARDAGTGLRNIASRLERLYGRDATLTVRPNDGAGTVVELTLPATPEAIGIRGVA